MVLHAKPIANGSRRLDCLLGEGIGRQSLWCARSIQLPTMVQLRLSWSGQWVRDYDAPLWPQYSPKSAVMAAYCVELCQRAVPEGGDLPGLLEALEQVLDVLRQQEDAVALRYFELFLLSSLGHLPDWQVDSQGQALDYSRLYKLQAGVGLFVETEDAVDYQGLILDGETLQQLASRSIDNSRNIRRLCRYLIDHHLQGKTLRSRQFFSSQKQYG